jgi:tRNA(fMet)-specific endonuclease VapC
MKVLLDTNAYTALMSDRGNVVEKVRRAEGVLLSSIVLGELLFGFRNGSRYEQNRARLDAFMANRFVELAPAHLSSAEHFGLVAAQLRRRGTPIPSNDIWIAAHAMATGAELISFDAHFAQVEGLFWTQLSPN